MSRRAKIITAVVVIALVVVGIGFFVARSNSGGPVVATATVTRTHLAVNVAASGKIASGGRQDVYPPTQATIQVVYVTDGATVTAGQKLCKLEPGPLELQLQQAQAGLAQASSAQENLPAQLPSSADIAAARAAVCAAKAAHNAAVKGAAEADAAYAAAKAFAASNPTSPGAQAAAIKAGDAATQAHVAVKQTYAALKQSQAALAKLLAADNEASRFAANQAVEQAQQAVDVAQANLDNATLVAPIDGVVLFNTLGSPSGDGKAPVATAGAAVGPQAPIFTVVDLGGAVFSAEVDEADIARVSTGMKAQVTLDAYPAKTFDTKVTSIGRVAQPTATGGTIFPVKITMADSSVNLLIGMKGDSTIEVSALPDALTIPLEALFNENGTNFVYVVDSGKLKKTEITVGAETDTQVQVIKGLKEGEVVALTSSTQYTDGMAVRTK